MGAEIYLHLDFPGRKLVCRTPEMETPGSRVSVSFNTDKIMLFDRETGETIGMSAPVQGKEV